MANFRCLFIVLLSLGLHIIPASCGSVLAVDEEDDTLLNKGEEKEVNDNEAVSVMQGVQTATLAISHSLVEQKLHIQVDEADVTLNEGEEKEVNDNEVVSAMQGAQTANLATSHSLVEQKLHIQVDKADAKLNEGEKEEFVKQKVELIAMLQERLTDKEDISFLKDWLARRDQEAATEWQKQRQQETLDELLVREQTLIREQGREALDQKPMNAQLHRADYLAARLKMVADDAQIDTLTKLDANSGLSATSLEELSTEIFCTAGVAIGAVWKIPKKLVNAWHNAGAGSQVRTDSPEIRQPGCLCTDAEWKKGHFLSSIKSTVVNAGKAMVGKGEDSCGCQCCHNQASCAASLGRCEWTGTLLERGDACIRSS